MKLSQKQLMEQERRKIARLNEEFMALVNHPTNPLTNEDLKRLIRHRPEVYGRFGGFVGKLKS